MFRWRGISTGMWYFFLKPFNHDMYLQRVCKSSLSIFDDKKEVFK